MWKVALVLAAGNLVLSTFCFAEPPTDPKDVISDAVEAQGGKSKLVMLQHFVVKERGKRYDGDQSANCEMTSLIKFPDHKKMSVVLRGDDFAIEQTIVFAGNLGWHKDSDVHDGLVKILTTEEIEDLKDEAFVFQRILVLYPLLEDSGFKLTSLGTKQISGRFAAGVKVEYKNRPTMELYFDVQTKLLVKYTSDNKGVSGAPPASERFYSDYKDFDGLKFPSKTFTLVAGKPYASLEAVELKFLKDVDESEFSKP